MYHNGRGPSKIGAHIKPQCLSIQQASVMSELMCAAVISGATCILYAHHACMPW
jgi:hypothetical protein